MFRIENKVSGFTESQPATRVTADWLNAVQESLCSVIEEAGFKLNSPSFYKSTPNHKLLYEAICKLIEKRVNAMEGFSNGKVKLFNDKGKALYFYIKPEGVPGFEEIK